MSPKQNTVKTVKFRRFLTLVGCKYYRTTKHEIWGRKDLRRNITFRSGKKEIPFFHIKTNLKTLNISVKDFLEIIEKI